jgi:hypothetical protein
MKNNINFIFFSLTVLFFNSCGSSKQAGVKDPKDTLYSIKRGACYGRCPVFDMVILQNGLAKLNAKKYNAINGKLEKQLTEGELNVLAMAFKEAELAKMDSVYPSLVADLPMTVIGQNIDGKIKTVRGNESMSDGFNKVSALLDGIARSTGWTVKETYPTEEETEVREVKPKVDNNIYEEIIIEPNPGVRLPVWFKEMAQYGIVLRTKIQGADNLWVISYDKSKYEPFIMLDIIKKDPNIKMAEFNKKLESRDK